MKVTLLGTGAPIHPTRKSLGLLLEAPNCEPLLIDTCGGFELTRALAKLGYKDERLQDLRHVVLTHQHGDHIGGVMALFIAVKQLDFYANPETLEAVDSLISVTYPQYGKARGHAANYHEVNTQKSYAIAGFKLSFFNMIHRVPTLAVRVEHKGKVLAFSADGLINDELLACAKNADLFICDAICAKADAYSEHAELLMHPTATDAAELAVKANVKALALTHLVRYSSPELMLKEARSIFRGPVSLPDDGTTLEV